jgi:hypothetical protein
MGRVELHGLHYDALKVLRQVIVSPDSNQVP